MTTLFLVLSIISILMSLPALTLACVALCYVVGLKNSTHQVVWKPIEPQTSPEADPFANEDEEVAEMENPNKRIKTAPKPATEDDFADLSDPSVTSNDW